ncbi:hypothetical protein CVT26_008712 [Gymnopilus dilepis]|uniref:Uncharacterized protein n=1 Tax=Gymnopilus dilepis TaxID=231916 RepID=A0A409X8N1_9AGAR|nr:hypothetical protein CVT26_008712 [Gymnopilus dilepis]
MEMHSVPRLNRRPLCPPTEADIQQDNWLSKCADAAGTAVTFARLKCPQGSPPSLECIVPCWKPTTKEFYPAAKVRLREILILGLEDGERTTGNRDQVCPTIYNPGRRKERLSRLFSSGPPSARLASHSQVSRTTSVSGLLHPKVLILAVPWDAPVKSSVVTLRRARKRFVDYSFLNLNPYHAPPARCKSGKSSGDKAGGDSKTHSRLAMASLQFPVGRVQHLLKKGNHSQRVGVGAPGASRYAL